MIPAADCVPATVTVYEPVASVPALNTATLPAVHLLPPAVPSAAVLQFLSLPVDDQMAEGVELPVPATFPLISQ